LKNHNKLLEDWMDNGLISLHIHVMYAPSNVHENVI
jgi:hypothetical protein